VAGSTTPASSAPGQPVSRALKERDMPYTHLERHTAVGGIWDMDNPGTQEYLSDEQHPDLYLSAFSREHPGLFGVGCVETNSAAYGLFDTQAQMIASFIQDWSLSPQRAELIRTDNPDLTGGLKFVSSPRHKGYVNSETFTKYLRKVIFSMGWRGVGDPPPVKRSTPDASRTTAGAR
jgi:hypothetical protein